MVRSYEANLRKATSGGPRKREKETRRAGPGKAHSHQPPSASAEPQAVGAERSGAGRGRAKTALCAGPGRRTDRCPLRRGAGVTNESSGRSGRITENNRRGTTQSEAKQSKQSKQSNKQTNKSDRMEGRPLRRGGANENRWRSGRETDMRRGDRKTRWRRCSRGGWVGRHG